MPTEKLKPVRLIIVEHLPIYYKFPQNCRRHNDAINIIKALKKAGYEIVQKSETSEAALSTDHRE